jgi:hypothetical protein
MPLLVLVASFAGGVMSNSFLVVSPDAQAQGTPQEKLKSTPIQRPQPAVRPGAVQAAPSLGEQVITVPATPGGLAFRMPDGKLLARLNYDRGAQLSLYDDEGLPVIKARAWGGGIVSVSRGNGVVSMDGYQIRFEHGGKVMMALTQDPYAGGVVTVNRSDQTGRGAISIAGRGSVVWQAP